MIQPQHWSLYSLYKRAFLGWERDAVTYCRYLGVAGKVVLDVGAGDFGTAREFLKRGAKKVICIERDYHLVPLELLGLGKVIAYHEPFDPERHLGLEHDCAKFDIEGYEILLLPYLGSLKRSIIEVHSEYMVDRFLDLGWKIHKRNDVAGERCIQCLMVNDK